VAIKTATLVNEGDGLRFVATAGSGHTVILDNAEGNTGARPAELVPLALAGCTAMDVISILRKKRQPVTRYEIRAEGVQRENPQPAIFQRIDITHIVEGDVDTEAVRRAIQLSAEKYCSVGATLATGATEVRHGYLIRRPGQADEAAEVVVEGPHATAHLDAPNPAPVG
jgi:putative redox protein